ERRAQTNLQLYGQLVAAGRANGDLVRVRDAYDLSTRLFTGQLRPEGRPFVCHLVGVASLLAMLDAPRDAMLAGLLHSAYTHGDFGAGSGRATPRARGEVRAVVGDAVERLVALYATHPWNAATLARWQADAPRLDGDERHVALIRLADVFEDMLDDGAARSSKASNPNRDVPVAEIARFADAMGYAGVRAAMLAIPARRANAPEVAALRSNHAGSYVVGPASWREKARPRLRRLVARMRGA